MSRFIKDAMRHMRIAILRLKTRGLREFRQVGKILIIAPHPDDEAIGCGGLIATLCSQNTPPDVVILTGGEGSHRDCCNITAEEIKRNRRKLALDSAKVLGLPEYKIHFMDLHDGSISINNKEYEKLLNDVSTIAPDIILVPHNGEGWQDHIAGREIGLRLAEKIDCKVYEYCVWMWYYNVWKLDWPNAYQLILNPKARKDKSAAIDAYIRPTAPCGKPWSGVLPKIFVEANRWGRELYFRVR